MRLETVDGDVTSLTDIHDEPLASLYPTSYAATAPPEVGALHERRMDVDEGEVAETEVGTPGAVVVTGAADVVVLLGDDRRTSRQSLWHGLGLGRGCLR